MDKVLTKVSLFCKLPVDLINSCLFLGLARNVIGAVLSLHRSRTMMFNDGDMLMDEPEMMPTMASIRMTMQANTKAMEGCGMGTGRADRMI